MTPSEQLSFPVVTEDETWQLMLNEIRGICAALKNGGAKQAAWDLQITGPDLSNMLAERNRSELKLKFLPYFLRRRLNDELPRLIVESCGLTLGEARPLTIAEKYERLVDALGRSGVVGQAILADAFGGRR